MSQVPSSTVQLSVTNDHPPGDSPQTLPQDPGIRWLSLPPLPLSILRYDHSCLQAPPVHVFSFSVILQNHGAAALPPGQGLTPRRHILYPSFFTVQLLWLVPTDVLRAVGRDEGLV